MKTFLAGLSVLLASDLDVREIKDDAGKALNMGMEMGSPNALMRAGWKRDSMKIGDEVVVEGFHAHTRKDIGNARVVILVKTGQPPPRVE